MTKIVRQLLVAGCGLLLVACSASTDQGDAPQADVTLPSVEATESVPSSSAAGPVNGGEPTINERGNIEMDVGQEVTLPDGGTVVLDNIEPIGLPCPADDEFSESKPEHGQFIRVDLRVATAPAGSAPEGGMFEEPNIGSTNFDFIDSRGVTFNTDMGTFSAFSCLPQEEQFPSGGLGPGQRFTGSLVLDVPDPNGTLIYFPAGNIVGGEVGYEFELKG